MKAAMADGSDPKETLRLLALLRKAGFTDALFSAVHHFKTAEKIESHLRYCRKTIQFRPGSNNITVQRRLRHIVDAISVDGDIPGQVDQFRLSRLAQDAVRQWP